MTRNHEYKVQDTIDEGLQQAQTETIHIHYFKDAIVLLKEEDHAKVVESGQVVSRETSLLSAYVFCCCYLLLTVAVLIFQVDCLFNPPIATVTIIPKAQILTLSGRLQLGRILPPLTISQAQTIPTTGIGHQLAKAATGDLTFYNGQFQSVTIAAGTIFTGASGIPIVTDHDAIIPAANPPSFGQVTVAAHASQPGSKGNIPAFDISYACCVQSVLVKNTKAFIGGQNERTYTTVTQDDIHKLSTVLKTTLVQSLKDVFQAQLKSEEQLIRVPCTQNVTSNPMVGEEATEVTVTVTETCSGVVYDKLELQHLVANDLINLALAKLGRGLSLQKVAPIMVTQVTVSNTSHPLVFLVFQVRGTFADTFPAATRQHIKSVLAGKTAVEARKLLAAIPGVRQVAIRCSGFGNDYRLPKDSRYIHLNIVS